MNVYEGLHEQYPLLYYRTLNLKPEDKERVDSLVKKYQTMWDNGYTVQPMSMMDASNPPKRASWDEEKEFSIIVGWLAESIWPIMIESWLQQFTRDQIVQALNVFTALDCNISFEIDREYKVNVDQIIDAWNKTHDESESIYKNMGVEP